MTVCIYTEPDGDPTRRADSDEPDTARGDPETLRRYLLERRRALITELRKIEEMLGLPQSVPQRVRPH